MGEGGGDFGGDVRNSPGGGGGEGSNARSGAGPLCDSLRPAALIYPSLAARAFAFTTHSNHPPRHAHHTHLPTHPALIVRNLLSVSVCLSVCMSVSLPSRRDQQTG